jgi:hypothetical protein
LRSHCETLRSQGAHLGELRRDLGDRHRAGLEWRDLESADRSVPDERPLRSKKAYGLRDGAQPDVEDHLILANGVDAVIRAA